MTGYLWNTEEDPPTQGFASFLLFQYVSPLLEQRPQSVHMRESTANTLSAKHDGTFACFLPTPSPKPTGITSFKVLLVALEAATLATKG